MVNRTNSSLTQGTSDTGDYVYGVVGGNSRKLQIGGVLANLSDLDNLTLTPSAGTALTINAVTGATASKGFSVAHTLTGTHSGQFDLNTIQVTDSLDNGASEGHLLMLEYDFGGSTLKGARTPLYSYLNHQAATSSSNTNRNYTAGVFVAQAATDDNGTSGSKKGALFALNPNVKLGASATNWLEASGGEVNTEILSGASVSYKNGWSIVQFGTDAVQGTDYDAAISLSNQSGAVGWNDGILLGPPNGQFPIKSNGNVLRTVGGTVNNGIDLSNTTVTTAAFKSSGWTVDGSGNATSTGFLSGATLRVGSVTFAQAIAGPFHQINDASGNSALFLGDNANISRATDFQFLSKDGTAQFGDWSTSGLRLGVAGTKLGQALFSGNTSGTTTVQPAAAASGTLTLPAATDTLVGKATTDELTNKTLTSSVGKGTWTVSGTWTLPAVTLGGAITYGGVTLSNSVTGTGSMVLSAGPTLTGTLTAATVTTSGDITISKATPNFIMNKSAESGQNVIYGRTNGSDRWVFLFGDATNSDWGLLRYDDSGVFIATAFGIARSTGNMQVSTTTEATATNAASFYTLGGIGVAKKIIAAGQIRPGTFTVASLPAGAAGDMAYATNGRAMVGSTGAANITLQGAGAGTGTPVFYNGSAWKVGGTNETVVA